LIINLAPTLKSTPPKSQNLVHGKSLDILLSNYFSEPEGDALTYTAVYILNGGATVTIPSGIF